MKEFECVHKGDIYLCQVNSGVYGGASIAIYKIRQGRAPKPVMNKCLRNEVEAMAEMEKYLPDAVWREKNHA